MINMLSSSSAMTSTELRFQTVPAYCRQTLNSDIETGDLSIYDFFCQDFVVAL